MKQIYDFTKTAPPVLNERELRRILNERAAQRQAAIFSLAGLLLEIGLLLTGILVAARSPLLALIIFSYVILSFTGGALIALVYTKQRRYFLWQS